MSVNVLTKKFLISKPLASYLMYAAVRMFVLNINIASVCSPCCCGFASRLIETGKSDGTELWKIAVVVSKKNCSAIIFWSLFLMLACQTVLTFIFLGIIASSNTVHMRY